MLSYLCVLLAWFVVYLTLSFLSDVVDRGGNKTAFGFFTLVIRRVLEVILRYLGVQMGDVSMIDMILPPY